MSKQQVENNQLKKISDLKTAETLRIAQDEAVFDKKYQGVFKTFDYLLSGREQKLVDSLLEDFAPPPESKRKPGLSARSVFRAIGFAFRNPGKIGSLITMARNYSEILNNNKFQQELLKSDNTWHFVQALAEPTSKINGGINKEERLLRIGQILANSGVKEFKEGSILDQEALKTLQPAFVKISSLSRLRNIAINFKNSSSDQDKNINQIFDLMKTSPDFKNYMQKKGLALKEYIVNTTKYYIEAQNHTPLSKNKNEQLSYQEQLNKYGIKIENLDALAEIVPVLLNNPDLLQKFYSNYSKPDYAALAKDLLELAEKNEDVKKYLQKNKSILTGIMADSAKALLFLEGIDLKGELSDLFGILLKSNKASQVKAMVEKYQKEDWLGVAIDFCKMVESDPQLEKQLMNSKNDVAKLTQAIVDNAPFVKQFTGDMKVDSLAINILQNPRSFREGIEAFQKGGTEMVKGLWKIAAKKVTDAEFRGAVIKGLSSWIMGSGLPKQQVINHIAKIGPTETSRNISDIASYVIKLIDNCSKAQRLELEDLVRKKQLFSRVEIRGTGKEVFNLEKMNISESFVNSTLINVSFKGSKITNSSFLNASFKNVNFEGAEIDGTTLKSMELQLQKNPKLLRGTKIIGDIPPGMNLSGIDLSEADLSAVTSMKGVNIKNTELYNAVLPPTSVIEYAYNLSTAHTPPNYVTEEMITNNQDKVINLMLDIIAPTNGTPVDSKFRRKIVEIYKSDTPIGQKLREELANDPHVVSPKFVPKSAYKHFAELAKADSALTVLYESKDEVDSIETKLYANIVADEITQKLFKKGNNRGQDAVLIRNMMNDSLSQFLQENPAFQAKDIIDNSRLDNIVEKITEKVKSGTVKTWWGVVARTEGTQLNKNMNVTELTSSIKTIFEQEIIGDSKGNSLEKSEDFKEKAKLTIGEENWIINLATSIGKNLFGDGHLTDRKIDTQMIETSLKEVFIDLKEQHNNVDIASVIEKNYEKLVGTVEPGTLWNLYTPTGAGLTFLYYGKSDSTLAGMVGTGGIALDNNTILSTEFKSNIKVHVQKEIGEELKIKSLARSISIDKSYINKSEKYDKKPPVVQEQTKESRTK